ncbi:PAS domain-containing sensor histidine kinase [Leptospira semungkisensis]|uniref:histidine kinase n=1 Tax=Leptospira semungkisensis TaxID=2484985 RepID=A0A4R9G7T1_9LEPT|nr:PAS domain-containing sensor histidine kinase [Leptospira semungkisensis]TGK06867.1 PAS domain-containing sensor histidine kinase [Leptospira semungkisensis]
MNLQDNSSDVLNHPDILRKIGDFVPCPFGLSFGEPGQEEVLYLNRAFLDQIGYQYEEITNAQDWFLLAFPDPEYRKKVMDEWYTKVRAAKKEGLDSVFVTVKIRLKNGQDKWFEVKSSLWDNYFVVAFMDIDEVYRQREELQRRNDFKDRVLSVLTHDLRTPLTQVGSLAELMLITDIAPEDKELFAKKIISELKSVTDFINNTAHWASANFGYLNIKKELFDAGELFTEIVSFYGAMAQTKKIGFSLQVKPPSLLSTDKEVLSIILRNLISNALKFTPPGKNVMVTAGLQDEKFKFQVEDQGMGIDPDHLRDLREGRLSSRLGTIRERGLGIGLSICFDMAKRLDAFLDFESEPSKGTRAILLV